MDGQLIQKYGVVSADPSIEQAFNPNFSILPTNLTPTEHIIAVRYSCSDVKDVTKGLGKRYAANALILSMPIFPIIYLGETTYLLKNSKVNQQNQLKAVSFITMMGTISILHFLLFIFYRKLKVHIFYSLFALSFAAIRICVYVQYYGHSSLKTLFSLTVVQQLTFMLLFIFFLSFIKEAFSAPYTRYFKLLCLSFITIVIINTATTFSGIRITVLTWGFRLIISLVAIEMLKTIVSGLWKRTRGTWILASSVLLFGLLILLDLLDDILGQLPFSQIIGLFLTYGLPFCVSIYLAYTFAQTHKDLEVKLVEVNALSTKALEQEREAAEVRIQREHEKAQMAYLEAENARKAKELEEARQLQLSMLPKTVPKLPNLEIAAYMQPASEVGGDYYDFYATPEGILTVALGDATGHGLKAGTMVTATKGLFNAFVHEESITHILKQSSQALKKMNLKPLYMAMMLMRIKDHQATISIAGMPAILVYKAASQEVVELSLKGMPLGSMPFPYKEASIELATDDIIMLMSDGFPERFNPQGEIFGYDQTKNILPQIAQLSSLEIIERLVEIGNQWAEGCPQDDDITFVVLKVKG